MQLIINENHQQSSEQAAKSFAKFIRQNPKAVLGFATGSTPLLLYAKLIEYYQRKELSFQSITAFNLDEYVGIAADNSHSYAYFMQKNLFSNIDILAQNCHIPNGMSTDLELECERYEHLILANKGIDIQLLGIGRNGHIGFNEPASSFEENTHIVNLSPSTLEANSKYFNNQNMPKKAITMGIASILRAKKIILLAEGDDKAKAIKASLTGEITPTMPASILQSHPNVDVYLDQAAASLL